MHLLQLGERGAIRADDEILIRVARCFHGSLLDDYGAVGGAFAPKVAQLVAQFTLKVAQFALKVARLVAQLTLSWRSWRLSGRGPRDG